ncbi:mersacidin/lichenicidin family type 2 lantibiotic [Dictyobacter kobayashii]|nr:mersacidin/lichenicidin family type 2 lantibiotic [Dictyobacter kobayashii]
MSIEDIVKAWKSGETLENDSLVNPAGEELSDEELREITGGMLCGYTCYWGCHGNTTCDESVLV